MHPSELIDPGRVPGARLRIMYIPSFFGTYTTRSVCPDAEEAPSQVVQLAISAILVAGWWSIYHLLALVGAP